MPRTLEELLDDLAEELPVLDSSSKNYTSSEIASVRALTEEFQKQKALHVVRELAASYKPLMPTELLNLLADSYDSTDRAPAEIPVEFSSAEELGQLLYHINPSIQLLSFRKGTISLRAPAFEWTRGLLPGYGFKGGAARLALETLLSKQPTARRPRDFDVIRFGKSKSDEDETMAAMFMPEDFKHGHGVELIRSGQQYLNTRDLSVNEVYLLGRQLVCSELCLRDMLGNKIRLTRHALKNKKSVGKVYTKALRIAAEGILNGKPVRVVNFLPPKYVQPFDIALHLDRALGGNQKVAELYLEQCVARGLLKGNMLLGDRIEKLRNDVSESIELEHLHGNARSRVPRKKKMF